MLRNILTACVLTIGWSGPLFGAATAEPRPFERCDAAPRPKVWMWDGAVGPMTMPPVPADATFRPAKPHGVIDAKRVY